MSASASTISLHYPLADIKTNVQNHGHYFYLAVLSDPRSPYRSSSLYKPYVSVARSKEIKSEQSAKKELKTRVLTASAVD
ncbi:hypothetical protein P9E03_04745 [Bacillus mojavensis]|uniref:hypothetical protein n=1 Tax=Bacillus mojavensis TaxID=72360 RepID=UPI00227F9B91|nr:hypothetical protein [Bacillus mojavensis]MCY9093005.1 hypothetical protein [Bacillus mojavensis]MEC1798408.1 hypothetical protein [Bacillus mojavensis]